MIEKQQKAFGFVLLGMAIYCLGDALYYHEGKLAGIIFMLGFAALVFIGPFWRKSHE